MVTQILIFLSDSCSNYILILTKAWQLKPQSAPFSTTYPTTGIHAGATQLVMFACGSKRFSTWTAQSHHPWSGCRHLCHHHPISKLLTAAHLQKNTHKPIILTSELSFLDFAHRSQKWMTDQDRMDKKKKKKISVEKNLSCILFWRNGTFVNLAFKIQSANSTMTLLESWRGI